MNWRRNPDVSVAAVLPDGYVVISNLDTDWAHVLNPVGALVWEFCDGELSAEEITEKVENLIASQNRAALKLDIENLARELLEAGLLIST